MKTRIVTFIKLTNYFRFIPGCEWNMVEFANDIFSVIRIFAPWVRFWSRANEKRRFGWIKILSETKLISFQCVELIRKTVILFKFISKPFPQVWTGRVSLIKTVKLWMMRILRCSNFWIPIWSKIIQRRFANVMWQFLNSFCPETIIVIMKISR